MIILAAGDPQHLVAGLTTQSRYLTTSQPRPGIPNPIGLGLDGTPSFLWSDRPARLCRIDVQNHVGWITREVVDLIAEQMRLDHNILAQLWSIACHHATHHN